MHEISLIKNIFQTLDASYDASVISTMKGIYLKIGILSNVQSILMQNAFDAVVSTDAPHYANVKLHIEVMPIVVHCNSCQINSHIENYTFVCSQCKQPTSQLVSGDELLISGIET